jgi:hypothetical protein
MEREFYNEMAKQTYADSPLHSINGYTLVQSTPTLKFYMKGNIVVVAVRGTKGVSDLMADASLPFGALTNTSRFRQDLAYLQNFQQQYPKGEYTYYATGHSLGGAIIDEFIKRGLINSAYSFNPAVSSNVTNHERIYQEDDPLYKIMGRFAKGTEVKRKRKNILESIMSRVSGLPYSIYSGITSHSLRRF